MKYQNIDNDDGVCLCNICLLGPRDTAVIQIGLYRAYGVMNSTPCTVIYTREAPKVWELSTWNITRIPFIVYTEAFRGSQFP